MSDAIFVTSLRQEHLVASWSVKLEGERAAFAETFTLGPDNKVIVSDLLNKKVKTFDRTGNLLMCVGEPTKDGNALRSPRGVASLPGGRIAVADPPANCVKVFDQEPKIQSKLAGAHIDCPVDVVLGPRREIFIATEEGKSVVSLRTEGATSVSAINNNVNMKRPGGMVLTPCGKLVICDETASTVSLLETKTLQCEISVTLSGNSKLEGQNRCAPAGVGADVYGYVYVADTNNNRIIVFDTQLQVAAILHTQDWFNEIRMRKDVEEMRLTLSGPVGVAVNDDGELWVLEQAGRVKVFRHFLHKPLQPIKPAKSACCALQ